MKIVEGKHNPKVAGSNPAPATSKADLSHCGKSVFLFSRQTYWDNCVLEDARNSRPVAELTGQVKHQLSCAGSSPKFNMG